MRSLSVRALLSLFVLLVLTPAVFAHDVTLTGTQSFASLDGSASDHDGTVNGVFTVSDGNLTVNGVVNCNDDGGGDSACPMTFAVSGNLTINSGGALFAENRSGGGTGGAITLTVGGHLALNGNAVVSTASSSSSGANGGAITANVSGNISVGAGTTIDSGSANARGGNLTLAAAGLVTVDGNVLSGPSRTLLSTRLTGAALSGGTGNQVGGAITISSNTFAEPAIVIGSTANVISQGTDNGAGPVTIDGCGVQVRGLIAALGSKTSTSKVAIRSGKDVLIDGRDLGGTGTRMGIVRADAVSGTAQNRGVDVFAAETIDVFGPASGSLFVITSHPGTHDSKSFGGLIRILSLGDAVNGSGNMIDSGRTAAGDTGGTIEISAKEDVGLNTAVIRALGDFSTNNPNRGGGSITIRSYSGDVIWTNGTGDVRPVGSTSGLALADQGKIILTACGTVDTTGSSFPVMGTATSPHPATSTGVCSPAAPSLPTGVAPLITCNTPPVANDTTATTDEDTTVTITLSGSDADGDSLTFSIVSGPSNGVLGAVISTGPTTATVDYTPNANFFGTDGFVFEANDGNGGTDQATAVITVNSVNDPPSFLVGPTVTVLEDSGPQTYTNWVTAISPGPANESGQTVTFTVTNDNPSLFSVQPAVDSSGTLTFTPAADAHGTANLSVTAQDDGGTANGGDDTSNPQTSEIIVTPVNDEPSFTAGGDVTVNEDSGAYSATWATAISAGPNEGSQTLTFFVSNDDNSLFSAQPSIDATTGVLTFTPAANASGSATVSVYLMDDGGTANGGDETSPTVTFTITVDPVNDEPSFTAGGDVTVLEDSGSYNAAWATAISAGPNETQNLTFFVSNDNNGLFSAQPAIDASGNLTFTVAADAFGDATVSVYLMDDGGTANGGDDTSPTVTFTITVDPVNDAPSFTSGGDVTVNEDSGAYSAGWATAISAGPANESGQTVTFFTSNDNNALFSAQPSIDSSGVLTFTPAPNASGSAIVTVYAQDDGGIANGGDDTSGSVTFEITVTEVNDPPVAGNDSWNTVGNTELRVDLGAVGTPHVLATTGSGTGVLHNDSDPGEGDPVSVTGVVGCADATAPFDCTFGDGSKLSLNANGSFTFTPGPGVAGGGFQYTITDGTDTATGTVTITTTEMVWYVNGSAPAGGNGTSNAPFNSLAPLNGPMGSGDVDAPGHWIFVHNSTVNGNIEMEANQRLLGEGVGLTVGPYALVPAGTKPLILSGAADTVIVVGVQGVEIAGLSLNSTTAEGIDVTSGTVASASVNIHDNTVQGGPTGIRIDGSAGGNLYVTGLSNVTVSGSTTGDGIRVTAATFDGVAGGTFNTVSGGTIAVGASGTPVGGTAVVFTNVSGDYAIGTLTAYGSTGGVTVTGSALYTGSAGMRLTTGGGAINANVGVGLSVTTTTIGAAGLNFTSISAANAVNGIVLNNTDTVGGLTVSGTGTASSGGTIQNMSGHGVSLTSTTSPSFNNVSIQNTGGSGVKGTSVTNFTYTNGSIDGSGTAGGVDDSNIAFNTQSTGSEVNLTGTVTITNNNLTNARYHGVDIINHDGTLANVTITGNTLTSATSVASSLGSAIRLIARGSAAAVAHITKAAIQNNNISNFPSGAGIVVQGGNATDVVGAPAGTVGTPGSGTNVISITGNLMNGGAGGVGNQPDRFVTAVVNGRGQGNFDVSNNGTAAAPIAKIDGVVVEISAFGTGSVQAQVANNFIAANNAVGSAGIAIGCDADSLATTANDIALSSVISGNAVSQTDGPGIFAIARNSNCSHTVRIVNNNVAAPTTTTVARGGIRVDSGSAVGNTNVCLEISGNTTAGSTAGGNTSPGINLRKQGTNAAVNVFGIEGLTPSPTGTPNVENWVNSQNTSASGTFGVGGTALLSATSGFTSCTAP